MVTLRTFLIVLILLNALAFAALQGWLGTATPRGEPERLTNQLNPERIKLRPAPPPPRAEAPPQQAATVTARAAEPPQPATPATPGSASDAKAPPACVAFAPLSPESAHKLGEAVTDQPALKFKDEAIEAPSSWWVNLPPAVSKAEAEARVAELRQLGVTDFFIVQEPGPNQFAVSLGLFKQEVQAQRLLEQLQGKGLNGARVTPRGSATHRIEIRGPADRLAELTHELASRYPGASRQDCPP